MPEHHRQGEQPLSSVSPMSPANLLPEPPLERYHRVLQRLHWSIALLVISQLAIALIMTQLRSLQFGQSVISLHRQIGLLVMVLVLIRLALCWKYPSPKKHLAALPDWQRHFANGIHISFKILLILQPLIGVFSSWARGNSIGILGLVSVSSPWDFSEIVRQKLTYAHAITASMLLALIAMHMGAIVFNRLIRKASVLELMLPGRSADKLINRITVAGQLAIGFSLLICIVLLTGLYSVAQYRDATRRSAAMQAGELAATDETREAQVAWKELVGRVNSQPAAAPDAQTKELAETAISKLNDALKHSPPGDVHTGLEALLGKIDAATPAAGAWPPAKLVDVDSDLQDIVDSESASIFQLRSENAERTAKGHDLLVLAMVPTLVLGLLVSALLSRSINGSLTRMSALVRAVADGTPAGTLQVIGSGEFSRLMREMLGMRAAVEARGQAMVEQIQQIESEHARLAEESRIREVASEALGRQQREQQRRQLTRDFETQVAGIVESVVKTVANLKETADRMATSAGNTSRCNRDASDMARQTSNSAVAIAPSASRLTEAASGFREHAERSRSQALQVIEEAAEARAQIETLAGAARQIGTIAHEISGISRQTSLLAINARIQAALAGDEGKGFAVVATEVKELAAKTRNAVDGIGGHIEHVTSVANQSAEFLQRVLVTIESLESAATSICGSADAQCASTSDIAQRIDEVSTSTQSVARNIDAAQATATDTESMAATVVQAAETMSQEALQLQDQVARFVLEMQGVGRQSMTESGAKNALSPNGAAPVIPSSKVG
jgi:methyl-accepting chemotaxis protein/cytochrome b561